MYFMYYTLCEPQCILAIQMWTLAHYLPFLVAENILSDDRHWLNFLSLLGITDYLVAPRITNEHLAYLKVLIQDHHSTFKEIYPDASRIPKLHYLTHTARLISK